MDDPTTTATLDQADENILTYTASDEALEAAPGIERGARASYYHPNPTLPPPMPCLAGLAEETTWTKRGRSFGGLFALSVATRKGVVLHGHLLQRISQVLAHSVALNPRCWGLLIEVEAGVSVAMR